jgi:hypothetical protein
MAAVIGNRVVLPGHLAQQDLDAVYVTRNHFAIRQRGH